MKKHLTNNDIIVFIHGIYKTSSIWDKTIFHLKKSMPNAKYLLIDLPRNLEFRNSCEFFIESKSYEINNIKDSNRVIIIGHSLGSSIACNLAKKIKNKNIIICLSSIPLNINHTITRGAKIIDRVLIKINNYLPVISGTIFSKYRLITYCSENNILYFLLKKDGYGNLLKDCPNIIYISVGCGYTFWWDKRTEIFI